MKKKTRRTTTHRRGIYPLLVELPDYLYPFAANIEGQIVRGKKSYDLALKQARRKFGAGHFGYKIMAYRQVCHFVGALALIILSTLVAQDLFGSEAALYSLLVIAVIAVSFQEFYLHPRYYGQLWRKSVTDWAVWVTPIAFFLYLHLH